MATRTTKTFAAALLAACAASGAFAQVTGPAPVAWRWQQPLTTDTVPIGQPVVDGGVVFVNNQQRVYAIGLESGNQVWRYPAGAPAAANFLNSPAVGGGMVFVLGSNRIVYAIDEKTGETKWTYTSPSGFIGQPIYTPQALLFALGDGSIMALKPADGTPYYDTPLVINNGLQGEFRVAGNDIICFNGSSALVAINIATRHLDWSDQFTSTPAYPVPVVYQGNIYVGAGGYVASISGTTGMMNWHQNIGQDIAFWPAVGSGGVAVATPDGNAYTFTLSGQPTSLKDDQMAPIALGTYPQTAPTTVGDSTFVFPTSNGTEVMVKGGVAQPVWSYPIRPIGGVIDLDKNKTSGGGAGGSGLPGMGSPGGGKAGGGGGGNINQNKDQTPTKIVTVQAASPAVLAGTTILQWCRDGSLVAFDPKTGVDVTPPIATMKFPSPGATVNGQPPLVLVFDIQDYSTGVDPSSVSITIDGKAYDCKYTLDGLAVVFFSVTGKNPPLQDGRHVITVAAVDWLGNKMSQNFLLNIDNTLAPITVQDSDQNNKNGGAGGAGGPGGLGGGPGGR